MTEVTKSSDEILTELFDSFKAEASVNVSDSSAAPKSPKDEPSRSKKKRKKDKKHKSDEKDKHRKKKKCKRHRKKESSNQSDKSSRTKKKKRKKYSSDSYDSEVEAKQSTNVVTAETCNKENNLPEEKTISEVGSSHISSVVNSFAVACDTSSIPLPPSTGLDSILAPKVAQEVPEVKKPQVSEVFEKHAENVGKPVKKLFLQGLDKPKMSIKIGNLKNSQVLEAAEEAKIKADKYEEGEITDETSEESTKLLMKIETETTSENGSIDLKKQKLQSEEKIGKKRMKSSDSANMSSSIGAGDIKSDENKCSRFEGSTIPQLNEETYSISENFDKVNKRSDESEAPHKSTAPGNKSQQKLKKLRQLRERKVDNSSSEDEYTNTKKSPSSKSATGDGKKTVNKSKKRSNKHKSGRDSDKSSYSSESSSSLDRTRSSKSKEESKAIKDVKTSSKVGMNSSSKRTVSPKAKYRKSRERSVSEDKHSSSKSQKTRSSSRSKLRKSRSRSKSEIRNSQSRYFSKKSRSKSKSRQKKSLSRSRERKSRSYSYSRSRVRRSRSRSRVRRSRTPKKYERKSRSVSKSKKSPTPSKIKSKKSRSPSKTKRRSSSLLESRGRKSRSLSRLAKRKSRSRGRKSSRSPSKLSSSKIMARRSSSRSNIRSLSRNRSTSKSRHSRSENRRSRSKNKRSSNRYSRSRDSRSKSKLSGVKNLKGNKERSNRSSSKLSDSCSDKSESDSKYKGSKKKKLKEKKSNSKKHKSKYKDINSRLLALSSTKVEASSEDSSSGSASGDSDGDRKKSNKARTLSNHKSKSSKSKKDLKGKEVKDKAELTKSKIVKEVDLAEETEMLKPKINLKQKIHYSLIEDEPIAMTESEMKILNAKNKLISKTINSISSTDLPNKNLTEKERKDFSCTKRMKSNKQEEKTTELGNILKNTIGKSSKSEDQLRKLRTDETRNVTAEHSPKNAKLDDFKEFPPKGKSGESIKNAYDTSVLSSKSKIESFSKKLDVKENAKSPSYETPVKATSLKAESEEKKASIITNKNSQEDDVKNLGSDIESLPMASPYDSDGQRSDTAMRNIFLNSQSSSNSPDHERSIKSYPGSNNNSNSSESESNDEKTFFGISKDPVGNTYEVGSKTDSLIKAGCHSSDSNRSLDKNITDSDEDLTFEKKQLTTTKHISDSIENTTLINKKDSLFDKSSCLINDHLNVQNCIESIESTNESSLSTISLKDPTSIKSLSSNSKESSDKKHDILLELSPRKTNSQDFLYDYEKSEIEDEKLDFDEDKSSESDVLLAPLKVEDMEILNQKEKSSLRVATTKANAEVTVDEININKVKNLQEGTSSLVLLKKLPVSNDHVVINKAVLSKDDALLANEKVPEATCNKNSPSNKEVSASISSNTLDIPVPSEEKLGDIKIPIPCSDYKKELNELHISESEVHSESKGSDKIDESNSTSSRENVHKSQFVKNESMILKTYDSVDDTTLSSMPIEDNKQKVTATLVKSVSRSRSRSKINKCLRKSERSKSRSRRETSSSRRSKSKDRSTSRRPKSKEKSSSNRKGRSKSCDKRSRSKVRHSRSKERRRRSRERSLSGSGRSRSKDKSSRLKDRRSRERRSRSRRRALSRSQRRLSRDRSSRSRRRNRSRSRDKKSRSRDRKNRSKSIDKRSRSRGRRPYSRSRERSRSRRHRGRSQSSRSRSYTRKERSRTKSKNRSESKDKKNKKGHGEHHEDSKVKLFSRSMSLEKKSDVRANSSDKKSKSFSKQEKNKSRSRSSSKENKEEKNNGHSTVEEFKPTNKIILNIKSPVGGNSNVILASKKTFSRSKSKEDRSSSENEIEETKISEKSPDRSSKEKSQSPLSSRDNSVPEPKKYRSRSNSVSKCVIGNKKSNSPETKLKRSRTKSPDIKRKKSKTKSPDSKTRRRSRSKSRDKQKNKEKRVKSKDRSGSKEVKSKSKVVRKSRSRERKSKTDEKSSKSQRKRSRTRSKSKEKNKSRDKRSRSRERRSKSRDKKSRRSRSRSRRRKSDKKDRSRRTRSRSKSRSRKRSKKSRSRSRSKDEFFIDKSKLLEIARKNALSMMKQGAVGTDLNKVTAITAGGKTVDELTDFCKLLSQKDATGQESVSSESSSENEKLCLPASQNPPRKNY